MYVVPDGSDADGISIGVTLHAALVGDGRPSHAAVARLDGLHPETVSVPSDRVYHVLAGTARFFVGTESYDIQAGDTLFLPKGTTHSITGRIDYIIVDTPAAKR